jgi:hypothetical protein
MSLLISKFRSRSTHFFGELVNLSIWRGRPTTAVFFSKRKRKRHHPDKVSPSFGIGLIDGAKPTGKLMIP